MSSEGLTIFSDILGWLYFLAWSISFYPQTILNYKRKSVDGLSFEYLAYNITGFVMYAIYNIVSYQEQHRLGLTKSVKINDIAFALHAVLLTSTQIFQCFIYERRNQVLNIYHAFCCACIWLLVIYNLILASGGYLPWYRNTESSKRYDYSVIESLGMAKVFISFIKYVPQAYLNYRRKSTIGWAIGNVLLDFTGGVLSFFQQFVDGINKNNWGEITENIPKLLLALESIVFDLFFMFQHYVLYPEENVYEIAYDQSSDNTPTAKHPLDAVTVNNNDTPSSDRDWYKDL